MKPDAMFFCYFLILLVLIPLITTQPYICQKSYSNTAPYILQPSNNQPYQNPTQIDSKALQETLNQLVFSKFLSNPSLNSIIDPNTKLPSQNGELIQGSNGNVPSVINNYFIVPPEFFNMNDTVTRKDGQKKRKVKKKKNKSAEEQIVKELSPKEGTKRKKGGRRIKSKNLEAVPNHNEEVISVIDDNKPKKRKRTKSNSKKQNLVSKPHTEKIIEISETFDENPVKRNKKLRKRKPKPVEEPNVNFRPDLRYLEMLDIKPLVSTSDIDIDIDTEKPKPRKRNRRPKVTDVTDTNSKHLKNIEEPVDNSEQNDDLTENRKIRNSKTDINRKESREKHAPPYPNEMMKSFYPYFNQYYGNMPFNYEQFYNIPPYSRNSERNNRRKSNRKEKPKSKTVNVKYKDKAIPDKTISDKTIPDEIIPDSKVTEKPDTKSDVEITTEKSNQTEEVIEVPTEIPREPIATREDIITKENYEAWKDHIEDLQPYIVPELRENSPYNDFFNDYYPIFYDQTLYSNENVGQSIQSDESRYFYKTEAADLIRDRRKHDRLQRYKPRTFETEAEFIPHIDREGLRNKFKESSINLESKSNILEKLNDIEMKKENENIFRVPPGLENPDFKTRNIKDFEELNDYKTKDIQLDKLSVFSSTKTDMLPEIKRIRVPSKYARPKTENVETYYANSKVVKYGVPEESIESNESISVSDENEEKINDGHTTYVVAKSLGKIEDYYW